MKAFHTEGQPARPVARIDQGLFDLMSSWNRFWFAPADSAPLGVIRWLIGGMVVYSHLVWGLELTAFLGADGWNSVELVREIQGGQWHQSFWWSVPAEWMQTVHWICIGILVLFWIGCLTRITSILAFVIHISYCQRAALATFGLDQICGILLLYLMLGPAGADYSVDSLWRRFRRRRQSRGSQTRARNRPPKTAAANLSIRLIQIHYCIIYFFAATGKLQGETWWTGEALWSALANYEYQSADMTWLAWFPEILQLMTHVTILWELSFAYLIWVPALRPLMLIVGALMHLGIGAFLGMWTFGLAMIFGYVAFLDPETVRSVMEWRPFRKTPQFS